MKLLHISILTVVLDICACEDTPLALPIANAAQQSQYSGQTTFSRSSTPILTTKSVDDAIPIGGDTIHDPFGSATTASTPASTEPIPTTTPSSGSTTWTTSTRTPPTCTAPTTPGASTWAIPTASEEIRDSCELVCENGVETVTVVRCKP